ncbi:sensor histidine kinase [Paenibacillus sp. FSL H8-0034]|uniref:sensor histidine kinase n=1 Tax=Paenibacillus sp. FSL H8-0034 TaxID=2954671 RepID=UPI0030F9012B
MKLSFGSIRARMNAILVLIILLSFVTLGIGMYNRVSGLLLKETKQSINYTTEVLDRDIHQMQEDIDRLAKGMYTNNELGMLVHTFPDFSHPQYVNNQISSYLYMKNMLSTRPYVDSVYVYQGNQAVLQFGAQVKKPEERISSLAAYPTIDQLPSLTQYWLPVRAPDDPPEKPHFISVFMNYYDNSSLLKSGLLQINMELTPVFRILTNNVTGDRKFYVITRDGQLLFGTDSNNMDRIMGQLRTVPIHGREDLEMELDSKSYLVTQYPSQYGDWVIINAVPTAEINYSSRSVLEFMVIFMIIAGTLILSLSIFISSRMLKPVTTLTRLLQSINFDKKIEWTFRNDMTPLMGASHEIGLFSRTFAKMMDRLEAYTVEIEQASARQRNLELELLLSQIKPHFLYNTLESFCGLAKLKRTDDIYKLAKSLGLFYRISLSKGAAIITVREELEHVNSYLLIEKMKYNDRFDYHIEMEPSLQSVHMLKLLLQPVVENAIAHGIRHVEHKGFILIYVHKNEEFMEFLVKDNGYGISPSMMQQLNNQTFVSTGCGGFGISNIKERLQLFYGDSCSLLYTSPAQGGTEVTLRIPLVRETNSS